MFEVSVLRLRNFDSLFADGVKQAFEHTDVGDVPVLGGGCFFEECVDVFTVEFVGEFELCSEQKFLVS